MSTTVDVPSAQPCDISPPPPALPLATPLVSCAEPLSIIIEVLLALGIPGGATEAQILAAAAAVCDTVSENEFLTALAKGARTGALCRSFTSNTQDAAAVYHVNAIMGQFNPSNQKYQRRFCELWK